MSSDWFAEVLRSKLTFTVRNAMTVFIDTAQIVLIYCRGWNIDFGIFFSPAVKETKVIATVWHNQRP